MKWGGAVVSVVLLVVWVGSAWYGVMWETARWPSFGLYSGTLEVFDGKYAANKAYLLGWHWHRRNGSMIWGVLWPHRYYPWSFRIPLWAPLLLAAGVSTAAWHLDTLARRRANKHLCPKCTYDRTGLAVGAVCPECGTAAPVV